MHFFPFFTFTSSFFLYTSKMNTKLCLYLKYLLRSIYLKYLYLFPFFFLIWFHSEINTRYSKNRKIEKKRHTIYVENPKSRKTPRMLIGHQISLWTKSIQKWLQVSLACNRNTKHVEHCREDEAHTTIIWNDKTCFGIWCTPSRCLKPWLGFQPCPPQNLFTVFFCLSLFICSSLLHSPLALLRFTTLS